MRGLVRTPERRLLILAAVTRIVPAIFIYGTEDVSAWHRCAAIIDAGGNPYNTPLLISWPPLWPLVAWFSYINAEMTPLPFPLLVKMFPMMADIIIVFVLYANARRFGLPPYRTAMAYALNPVAIYTSAIHGNFDSIPALCLTMAIVSEGAEGLWLGIGAAFKTWPLLMLPAFVAAVRSLRRQVAIAATAIGVFLAALLLPWPLVGSSAIASIVRYRGYHGWWGIPSIEFLSGREIPRYGATLIFYGAMAAVALLLLIRKPPASQGALLLLVTFYVTTPGFGLQYLVWIVPVALIADQRRGIVYSILAGAVILFELLMRPYTGHAFDALRFLPHSDFARHYGGPVDQHHTAVARLVIWSFFVYWWITLLLSTRREKSPRSSSPHPSAAEIRA